MSTNIQATHVRIGVNMGDHAETVRTAIEVLPGDEVKEIADRILGPQGEWIPADYDSYIEVRLVKPAEEPKPQLGGGF